MVDGFYVFNYLYIVWFFHLVLLKPTVLIGRIPSKNQEFFRISPEKIAKLPIRVNGEDYCKNGIPQDYSIKIENPQGTEDVCIRIEFHLQPGSFPELKVTDLEGKYKITAFLTGTNYHIATFQLIK